MKLSRVGLIVLTSLFLSNLGTAVADDVAPTRSEQVSAFQAKYTPLFDDQYAKFMIINSKIKNDASMLPSFKKVLADFQSVRKFIDTSLLSADADLGVVISYADEELGEFSNTLFLLEKQLASHKTITCVKGKVSKKVMALKPACPKGYKKK